MSYYYYSLSCFFEDKGFGNSPVLLHVFLSYFQGARLSLLDNGSIDFKSSFSTKGGWVAVNECYYFKNKHDPKRPVHTLHIHLDKQRCTQDSGQYFQVKVLLEGSKHCCAR